ncbi:MAG: hypothetical protein K9J81_07715, partial [Desulfohalobiaceae bacterium]|nr:hypothetical protein [Desulfohalobiaceae bacterium]
IGVTADSQAHQDGLQGIGKLPFRIDLRDKPGSSGLPAPDKRPGPESGLFTCRLRRQSVLRTSAGRIVPGFTLDRSKILKSGHAPGPGSVFPVASISLRLLVCSCIVFTA